MAVDHEMNYAKWRIWCSSIVKLDILKSSGPEWTVCLSFRFDFFVLVTLHARLRWHSIWEKIDNRCYYVSTQLWINEKSIMETTGSNELQWVFLCCAPHWYTESAPRRKSNGMHSNGFALHWIPTEPGSDELYWVLHWFVLPCLSIAVLYYFAWHSFYWYPLYWRERGDTVTVLSDSISLYCSSSVTSG